MKVVSSKSGSRDRHGSVFRKFRGVPYPGYLLDEQEAFRLIMLASPNLRKSEKLTDKLDLVRSNDFKELIAVLYNRRNIGKIFRRGFALWKIYAFRIALARNRLKNLFIWTCFLRRRLRCWRIAARKDVLLKRGIRRFCRKLALQGLRRWKHETRWTKRKRQTFLPFFSWLIKNMLTMREVYQRWEVIVSEKLWLEHEKFCATKIQRLFRRHSFYRRCKAGRFLRSRIVKRFMLKLVLLRNHWEKKRMEFEQLAIKAYVKTALGHLDKYIHKTVFGRAAMKEFTHSVWMAAMPAAAWNNYLILRTNRFYAAEYRTTLANLTNSLPNATDKEKKHKVVRIFPTPQQLPEIATMWTHRGKCLLVLRTRCVFEAQLTAAREFRKGCPPPYDCSVCGEVSLNHSNFKYHQQCCEEALRRCLRVEYDDIRGTLSWKFSGQIVSEVMAALYVTG